MINETVKCNDQPASERSCPDPAGSDPIVQVNGFGVANTASTQCNFMLVGLTESGKVVLSTGDGIWSDVSPKPNQNADAHLSSEHSERR